MSTLEAMDLATILKRRPFSSYMSPKLLRIETSPNGHNVLEADTGEDEYTYVEK
jgi:hypothetical protein